MSVLEEILKSNRKPKEKVALLAEKVKGNKALIPDLLECFKSGSATEKGHCMEAMQYISRDKPDIVLPYIDFIIEHLDAAGTRVKWEAAEIIHNLAQRFPDSVVNAVPKLLANVNDNSTIARWSAAYALTEIAHHNPGLRGELIPKFNVLLEKEKNSGVRNLYLKALKSLGHKKDR